MAERQLRLKELLELLPELPEFDALRIALLHASADDPQQAGGTRPYATMDGRVVAGARLGRVLMDAEQAVRRRVQSLFDAATIAFSGIAASNAGERIQQLVGLGEAAEQEDRWRDAVAYYSLAEALARRADHTALILLRRRLGRAYLNIGRMNDASHYYNLSLIGAATVGDDDGQVIAATGLGNVASWAGRWADADAWYERALRACTDAQPATRVELMINRAMVANERFAPEQAEDWLAQAYTTWSDLPAATRAGWLNIRGLVHLRRGQILEAEAAFASAVELAGGAFHRAMILDNFAEAAIQRGDFAAGLARARQAEAQAFEHGSARALAEIYMRMGRCCALQDDINGVAFFEKALDLARDEQYPLLLGRIYREYAQFRIRLHDRDAAKALLLQALTLFVQLGAQELVTEAETQLREI